MKKYDPYMEGRYAAMAADKAGELTDESPYIDDPDMGEFNAGWHDYVDWLDSGENNAV